MFMCHHESTTKLVSFPASLPHTLPWLISRPPNILPGDRVLYLNVQIRNLVTCCLVLRTSSAASSISVKYSRTRLDSASIVAVSSQKYVRPETVTVNEEDRQVIGIIMTEVFFYFIGILRQLTAFSLRHCLLRGRVASSSSLSDYEG